MRRSSGSQGQPVGGRTSEPREAPGSDRPRQPPDASGSASPGRACLATAHPGRGGRGAGLQEAAARRGGQGGAWGGGAGPGAAGRDLAAVVFTQVEVGAQLWLLSVEACAGAERDARDRREPGRSRGAGRSPARPWSSAAAMSAQCCAGQVSGAGLRPGGDGSDEARRPDTVRACLDVHPSSGAGSGAGGGSLRADLAPPGLVSRARARLSAVGETLYRGRAGRETGKPERLPRGLWVGP